MQPPIELVERKKNTSLHKGTSAFSSWFHPNSTCIRRFIRTRTYAKSLLSIRYRGLTGSFYCRCLGQRVQRDSCKGVISEPVSGEACTTHFSLWAVLDRNHVFGHRLTVCACCLVQHYSTAGKPGASPIFQFCKKRLKPARVPMTILFPVEAVPIQSPGLYGCRYRHGRRRPAVPRENRSPP